MRKKLSVTLTAVGKGERGYFAYWEYVFESEYAPEDNPITVIMDSDKEVSAWFGDLGDDWGYLCCGGSLPVVVVVVFLAGLMLGSPAEARGEKGEGS